MNNYTTTRRTENDFGKRQLPASACLFSSGVALFLYPRFSLRIHWAKKKKVSVRLCHNEGPNHAYFSRLYMDGWRDGLNRLWRDGVTILPRPAKNTATAKNNRPVPALGKKKTPPRPVPSGKKKATPSRLGKKNNRPVPPRKKKTTAPSRLEKKTKPPRPAMNSKVHRLEGGNWKQIPPPVSFSLFLVAHFYRIVV